MLNSKVILASSRKLDKCHSRISWWWQLCGYE